MDKYDLHYEVARDRFNSQDDLRQEFDRKATTIISVGGVVLGLGFVYLRLRTPADALFFLDPEGLALTWVFGMFVVAAAHCLYALWPEKWYHDPSSNVLREHLDGYTKDGLTLWVADEYTRSVENNQPRLVKTARLLRWAMAWLVLEVLALAAVFFASLV